MNLRYARWQPPAGRKGTVCIFQGRSEWIEKYFETVRDLRARGFAVATLDWRGQGLSDRALSDRRKGYVRDFSEYDSDLETFMREIVLPDCPPPIFALGHSTGATVLIRAAHQRPPLVRSHGADLAADPARRRRLYDGGGRRHRARCMRLAGLGAMYVPKADTRSSSRGPSSAISSPPIRCAMPAMRGARGGAGAGVGAPTVAWVDSAFRAMAQLQERSYPARIRQPIMIVAGGSDQVVSTDAIEDFATMLRAGSHLVIVGAQHEILMEQDRFRSQFWAAFDAFVPGTPLY